jgi:hypothetical protein
MRPVSEDDAEAEDASRSICLADERMRMVCAARAISR